MSASPTPAERLALKTANAALLSSPNAMCDIVATVVFALGSAQLLQSPETAAALAAYEVLNPQQCPKGIHADWLVDSENSHACPWCESDRLRARVAELEAAASLSRTEAIADVGDWLEETGDQGAAYMVRTCEIPAARDMRLIAVEDPHDSPLHHDYRTGRDLPEVTQ